MRKVLSFILCIIMLCFTLPLASSCSDDVMPIISNYSDYVSNLFQYYFDEFDASHDETSSDQEQNEEPSLPSVPEYKPIKAEEYSGLTAIDPNKFDFGTSFFGNYAYVSRNGENFLLDRNGNLTKINDESDSTSPDIVVNDISYDKFIVSRDGNYGVLDLFGNILAEIKYDDIEIFKEIILARSNSETDIYLSDKLLHNVKTSNVTIVSDELLSVDGNIVSLVSLAEAEVGGFKLAGPPSDNIVKVTDERGRFGYCSYPEGQVLIKPEYFISGDFFDGVTYAFEFKADLLNMIFVDYPLLLDINNKVLFDFDVYAEEVLPDKITVFDRYDNCNVYHIENPDSDRFGVVFESGSEFIYKELNFKPKNNRVYGNYYIADGTDKLCSIENDALIESEFSKFYPIENLFIGVSDTGKYFLVDGTLNIIIDECESIEFYDGLLTVKNDGKYSYYKINE